MSIKVAVRIVNHKFNLKDISSIKSIGSGKNSFYITVSQWVKKDQVKNGDYVESGYFVKYTKEQSTTKMLLI